MKNEVIEKKNEIVVYQPDENLRLEVKISNETVWLTQEQMIALFDVPPLGYTGAQGLSAQGLCRQRADQSA